MSTRESLGTRRGKVAVLSAAAAVLVLIGIVGVKAALYSPTSNTTHARVAPNQVELSDLRGKSAQQVLDAIKYPNGVWYAHFGPPVLVQIPTAAPSVDVTHVPLSDLAVTAICVEYRGSDLNPSPLDKLFLGVTPKVNYSPADQGDLTHWQQSLQDLQSRSGCLPLTSALTVNRD